jgi:hypothetical protein
MPLEISEIGVRVTVDQAAAPPQAAEEGCGGTTLSPAQVQQIIQSCVQDVIRTLRMLEVR